jgi:hypothetical protein
VKNDSTHDGDEVVQIYVNRELRAFQRIHLRAGETRQVRLPVAGVPQGKVTLTVGGSQHGIEATL